METNPVSTDSSLLTDDLSIRITKMTVACVGNAPVTRTVEEAGRSGLMRISQVKRMPKQGTGAAQKEAARQSLDLYHRLNPRVDIGFLGKSGFDFDIMIEYGRGPLSGELGVNLQAGPEPDLASGESKHIAGAGLVLGGAYSWFGDTWTLGIGAGEMLMWLSLDGEDSSSSSSSSESVSMGTLGVPYAELRGAYSFWGGYAVRVALRASLYTADVAPYYNLGDSLAVVPQLFLGFGFIFKRGGEK